MLCLKDFVFFVRKTNLFTSNCCKKQNDKCCNKGFITLQFWIFGFLSVYSINIAEYMPSTALWEALLGLMMEKTVSVLEKLTVVSAFANCLS